MGVVPDSCRFALDSLDFWIYRQAKDPAAHNFCPYRRRSRDRPLPISSPDLLSGLERPGIQGVGPFASLGEEMPRRPDVPCNRCGELMWRGEGSRPEGQSRCRTCRGIEAQPYGPRPGSVRPRPAVRLTICPWCSTEFVGRNKCCSRKCAWASAGEQQRVRALDSPHQRRCDRAKSALGLSSSERSNLLARWMRQGKSCAYCDALATTVDHVIPLVRGGTNYEGNLVPACRSCNSRKAARLVIEWRMGRKARGRSSDATQLRIVRRALRREAA